MTRTPSVLPIGGRARHPWRFNGCEPTHPDTVRTTRGKNAPSEISTCPVLKRSGLQRCQPSSSLRLRKSRPVPRGAPESSHSFRPVRRRSPAAGFCSRRPYPRRLRSELSAPRETPGKQASQVAGRFVQVITVRADQVLGCVVSFRRSDAEVQRRQISLQIRRADRRIAGDGRARRGPYWRLYGGLECGGLECGRTPSGYSMRRSR
jgi:hypothetical protein